MKLFACLCLPDGAGGGLHLSYIYVRRVVMAVLRQWAKAFFAAAAACGVRRWRPAYCKRPCFGV